LIQRKHGRFLLPDQLPEEPGRTGAGVQGTLHPRGPTGSCSTASPSRPNGISWPSTPTGPARARSSAWQPSPSSLLEPFVCCAGLAAEAVSEAADRVAGQGPRAAQLLSCAQDLIRADRVLQEVEIVCVCRLARVLEQRADHECGLIPTAPSDLQGSTPLAAQARAAARLRAGQGAGG
jgi:hypothetical protein